MTPETFFTGNILFLAGAFVLAILILILAARHSWLVAYGPQQGRLRFWMAIALVLLVLLAASAAVFNLLFS